MIIDFLKGKIRPPGKKRLLTFKVSGSELLRIRVKAMKFTDGNVSEWVRYAALHLLPPVSHIDFNAYADPEEVEFYGEAKDEDSARYAALSKELKAFSLRFKKIEREHLLEELEDDEG